MIDLFFLAVAHVKKRRKRTALTVLGICIGIAAVVALVSLGQGLQVTVQKQFDSIGVDKIMVQAKELGFTGQFAPGQVGKHEVAVINDVHGVVATAGTLFRASQVRFNDVQRAVYVISVPAQKEEAELHYTFHSMKKDKGRLLLPHDKGKAIVGYSLAARNVFEKNVQVSDKIVVNDVVFDVVGTLKRIG